MIKRTIRPKADLPQSTRIEGARLLQLCGTIPPVPSATRTIPLRRNAPGRRYIIGTT
jgi:hypothetical protein